LLHEAVKLSEEFEKKLKAIKQLGHFLNHVRPLIKKQQSMLQWLQNKKQRASDGLSN
jgi:hypothetical protein